MRIKEGFFVGLIVGVIFVSLFYHQLLLTYVHHAVSSDVLQPLISQDASIGLDNHGLIETQSSDPGQLHSYIPSVTVGSASPRIPHIIHQTWDDEYVPMMFVPYIISWIKTHPSWQYWLWTPETVKLLLHTHYSHYESLYSSYNESIFKANIMRYFIMHHYGGVYADLDLESLRPLDNWTMDNDCIMSENHHVHAFLISKADHAEVMITLLASRPGHPYFKKAIDMLPSYKNMSYNNKLLYADKVYDAYNATSVSQIAGNKVTVTHPDYFLPTYDSGWSGTVSKMCAKAHLAKLNSQQLRTCLGLKGSRNGRKPKSFSYAVHYWEHVIMWGEGKKKKPTIHISQVVPTAVNLTAIILGI